MNLQQILGLEDIDIPNLDKASTLVKGSVQNCRGNFTSKMVRGKDSSYRPRSSPIVCISNGCSIKRSNSSS